MKFHHIIIIKVDNINYLINAAISPPPPRHVLSQVNYPPPLLPPTKGVR